MHDQLVSTLRRGVHPIHKGQKYANSVSNFLGPQLVLAMERGPFHKGQYAVFVSVCSDQAIYERFPTKNTLFNISDWGHDSMFRGEANYLQRFDCTMRFKQIVIKTIEMFGMLTVSSLYHSTDGVP